MAFGEGKKFFKRLLSSVPGTELNRNARIAQQVVRQSWREMDANYFENKIGPLQKEQDAIFNAHKKEIFMRIMKLHDEGKCSLNLREMFPELDVLYKEKAPGVEDFLFHLIASGAGWFAQQTETDWHGDYSFDGESVTWRDDAPHERGLWGVKE